MDDVLYVTAIFEDFKRKKYAVPANITAEEFAKIIKNDVDVVNLTDNVCIFSEGHVLENDELLREGRSLNEFSIDVVFTHPANLDNMLNYRNEYLRNEELADLNEQFPLMIGINELENDDNCTIFCQFMFGFVVSLVFGPFSTLFYTCFRFSRVVLIGMLFGSIVWFFVLSPLGKKQK